MDFQIVWDALPMYFAGLWKTIWLTVVSVAFGLALAVPLAMCRVSKNPFVNWPVWAYTYVFRGTPLLIQLYLIYFGLGQFPEVRASIFWPVLKSAVWCTLIAFTLNTAAYTTEIIRGAMMSTPNGEIEAATACGMSRWQIMRRVILPSAFRRALPAYGNEVIFMMHGTAVASLVTLVELTGTAKIILSRFYGPYEAYLTAAVFYMTLTFLIVFLFRQLETRMLGYLRPRAS